jgi:hypothetical protein
LADNACTARFADPEDARALLADSDHTFEVVAETFGASAVDRVSTHTWEKLTLTGDAEVAIAYSHYPASGVRLADNTDISTAAALHTDAIRVIDRNECGVFGAVANGIHSFSVLAHGSDSYIVLALAENAMESLAGSNDSARGFAIAVNAMPAVANAPNSEATTARAFAFGAGYFAIRRCSQYWLVHSCYLSFFCVSVS